jgi:hypothetical protein
MRARKDELLTWASNSDAHAEQAEAVQAELGSRPLHGRLATAKPSSGPGCGGRGALERSRPALLAAQLPAALSVPVELARAHRNPGGVRGWAAGLERQRGGSLAGRCRGGGQLVAGRRGRHREGGAGRVAAVGAPASRSHRAGQGGADGARGIVAGGGLCAAAEHGPHGWAARWGVGRCRPGRGSLPGHREPGPEGQGAIRGSRGGSPAASGAMVVG